jgi:glycosyltransferase A (GT-A) superfamily protein (DUF2064 family)
MPSPNHRVFEGIPWSTEQVAALTRTRLATVGLAWDELPVWYDVDEPADVERLRAELAVHPGKAARTARVLARA